MKDEMKKNYIAPEMTVVQFEHEGCLLGCSTNNQEEGCGYDKGFGLNDGVSDVGHV